MLLYVFFLLTVKCDHTPVSRLGVNYEQCGQVTVKNITVWPKVFQGHTWFTTSFKPDPCTLLLSNYSVKSSGCQCNTAMSKDV